MPDEMDLLTPSRLSELLQRNVQSCELDAADLEKLNGASYMRWATVQFQAPIASAAGESASETKPEAGEADLRVVLKVSKAGDDRAIKYGLAREAKFYQNWERLAAEADGTTRSSSTATCDLLAGFLPKVYFAEGDLATGAKRILMEDLGKCVQAGYWFGDANPNNWGKDLGKETARLGDAQTQEQLTTEAVTHLCFSAAAQLHAGFWNCQRLVGSADSEFGWLRGSQWLAGEDKQMWETSQASVRTSWEQAKAKAASDAASGAEAAAGVKWDPYMVELLDAAVAKADWSQYQTELRERPFTLTHGDFHPANFMVRPFMKPSAGAPAGPTSTQHQLALYDWEVVGLGSGPQDLGQFMISHVEPAERARIEKGAVRRYFDELVKLNPGVAQSLSWDKCWAEYVFGGLGRWMWFVPLLAMWCPPKMGQFFHDQVMAFAKAHEVTPETVPMPRA